MKVAWGNDQVSELETAKILELLSSCLEIPGDVVEFGCYRGDTSLLLQKKLVGSSSEKRLWLYDSFEGLPEKTAEDSSAAGDEFKAGELYVSKREVVDKFKRAGLLVPRIRKGFFENLTEVDVPDVISFGFLDGDLYESIKVSLKLCTKKVPAGGILVVHDYNNPKLPGVSRAVEEFLKQTTSWQFSSYQTLGILRKNP